MSHLTQIPASRRAFLGLAAGGLALAAAGAPAQAPGETPPDEPADHEPAVVDVSATATKDAAPPAVAGAAQVELGDLGLLSLAPQDLERGVGHAAERRRHLVVEVVHRRLLSCDFRNIRQAIGQRQSKIGIMRLRSRA